MLFNLFRGKPSSIIQENHSFFKKFDQSKSISEYEFVVFDTELTGLNIKNDEIVSIGAVRIKGLSIDLSDNFYALVQPENPLPKDSTLIHRITPEQIKNAPSLHELLPEFIRFCNGSLLVGHYVGLDIGVTNRACKKFLNGSMANPCIDTLRLSQVYKEEQWGNYYDQFNLKVSYNLADISKEYNLPAFTSHDALQDAIQTAYLFLFLVKKLRRGGLITLKDLYIAGRRLRWIF